MFVCLAQAQHSLHVKHPVWCWLGTTKPDVRFAMPAALGILCTACSNAAQTDTEGIVLDARQPFLSFFPCPGCLLLCIVHGHFLIGAANQ
jgi:hypothetical protein